jgi:hypothetical protein
MCLIDGYGGGGKTAEYRQNSGILRKNVVYSLYNTAGKPEAA